MVSIRYLLTPRDLEKRRGISAFPFKALLILFSSRLDSSTRLTEANTTNRFWRRRSFVWLEQCRKVVKRRFLLVRQGFDGFDGLDRLDRLDRL
jgi:hypothetical protein